MEVAHLIMGDLHPNPLDLLINTLGAQLMEMEPITLTNLKFRPSG